VKEILKYSVWPIVGMIFHPMYTIINSAMIGRLYEGDEKNTHLAALGLGSLTISILMISIVSCFCMVVGTFIGPAFGDERPDLCKRYLFRQYFLNCFSFLITLIPTLFIKDIFLAIG